MKKILTLTALGTVLLVANAQAAGFHLREQSTAAQGNAFAGATAGAENNTYAYFNAAGLTRQKGTQFTVGGTYIAPKAQAGNVVNSDGSRGSDINNIVHAAIAPYMTYSNQVNDKTFVGVSMNVPYGMVTKYDRDWDGSDHGITSKVTSVTVTPMAAYKATDKLSLGAGLQMQYIKAKLSNTAHPLAGMGDTNTKVYSSLQGDTFDVGYQLSALYELNDKTRFGASYRSQVKHKLKGEIEADTSPLGGYSSMINPLLNQDISARLTTPAMLSFGAYHELNDKWAIMAEYQRVFWSSFENLTIKGESMNQSDLPTGGPNNVSSVKENWRDTNFYAIGTNYKIDHQWTWRLGLAYDQSAVGYKDRTPRIPDSDRLWYSTGLSYKYNDKLTFDFAYTYISADKAKMNTNNIAGRPFDKTDVEYTNSVQLFGLSLKYNF